MKKYYPDEIQLQFLTTRPNSSWFMDASEFSFFHKNKFGISEIVKFEIFLLLDGCYNEIITFRIKQTSFLKLENKRPVAFTSTELVQSIKTALRIRQIKPENGLIIHSDRGTQFTSRTYEKFTKENSSLFLPSMSPAASPIYNSVLERFNRTIKSHKLVINNKKYTIVEYLNKVGIPGQLTNKKINDLIQLFVSDYNCRKKTKKASLGANKNNQIYENVKDFLLVPEIPRAFSEYCFKPDEYRRDRILKFKIEVLEVWNSFESTIPDNISFEQAKPVLLKQLHLINEKVDYNILIASQTKQDTEELIEGQKLSMRALGEVSELILKLDEKVESLVKKPRQKNKKIKLRDPVTRDHYEVFMNRAGSNISRLKTIKKAQLKIIYTILFYVGLRVNELRFLQKQDIMNAIDTSEFNIVHTKTNSVKMHIIPRVGQIKLEKMKPEIEEFFCLSGYTYLGGSKLNSEELYNESHFIRLVNEDMNHTCRVENLPLKLSTHSFRCGYITRLLKTNSVQNVSKYVGHSSVHSTMSYFRYVIDKEAILEAIKDAF